MNKRDKNLIYGRHPILDAFQAGSSFEKIWIQQGLSGDIEKELRHLCREHDVPMQYVPKDRLNRMAASGNHQGVAGLLSIIRYMDVEDVVPQLYEQALTPLLVILDGITDVRNLGAIARSVECLGAHGLVVGKKKSAPVNAEALKASAGALTRLPVCRQNSLPATVDWLRLSGIQLIGTTLEESVAVTEVNFSLPTAIVLGSEDEGISEGVKSRMDTLCRIPQTGRTESLNVSVAAGIVLYEALRQRSL